jgi:hypothetical protein
MTNKPYRVVVWATGGLGAGAMVAIPVCRVRWIYR